MTLTRSLASLSLHKNNGCSVIQEEYHGATFNQRFTCSVISMKDKHLGYAGDSFTEVLRAWGNDIQTPPIAVGTTDWEHRVRYTIHGSSRGHCRFSKSLRKKKRKGRISVLKFRSNKPLSDKVEIYPKWGEYLNPLGTFSMVLKLWNPCPAMVLSVDEK